MNHNVNLGVQVPICSSNVGGRQMASLTAKGTLSIH